MSWRPERGWRSLLFRLTLGLSGVTVLGTSMALTTGAEISGLQGQDTQMVREPAERREDIIELIQRVERGEATTGPQGARLTSAPAVPLPPPAPPLKGPVPAPGLPLPLPTSPSSPDPEEQAPYVTPWGPASGATEPANPGNPGNPGPVSPREQAPEDPTTKPPPDDPGGSDIEEAGGGEEQVVIPESAAPGPGDGTVGP